MKKINLQLFAQKLNTNTSIVDYLKSQGEDSSYTARKELAARMGITNYSGTAEQNVAMLNALKNGSGASAPVVTSTPANTNVAGSGGSAIHGVDKTTSDKMQSTYQQSDKVTNAQAEADKYLGNLKQMSSVTDIVDKSTWDAINKPFQSSTAYQEAMNYTNQLLQQLSSGRTSYTDQIKDLMGQIQNRDKFEYDVDSDVLFQQYLASSMASGKTAMQDTIGQASALTGGYGSTYATSAGNQQYNAYIQDAYNNLPEYYQMALEAYQMEGEEMYNQLSMLNQADATEFQRMYDSWNANFSNAQTMYENEYGAWHDSVNNAYNSASLQLQEHGQLYDEAYNTYTAVQNNANNLYAQEYQKWADEVSNAFNYAGLANSDYWNNENFLQRQDEFKKEMDYKYAALKQDNDQFYESLAQDQSQFEASLLAKNADSKDDNYSFTDSQVKQLQNAYVNANGGDAGEDAVLDLLEAWGKTPSSQTLMNVVDNIIAGTEMPETKWYDDAWEKTGEGKNFWGADEDGKDTYSLNGTTYTYSQLEAMLEDEDLTAFERTQILNKLKNLK